LQRNSKAESAYCLTVSFVDPHDKQFFWAGSEADRYYPTFDGESYEPYIAGYNAVPSEENPVRAALRIPLPSLGCRTRSEPSTTSSPYASGRNTNDATFTPPSHLEPQPTVSDAGRILEPNLRPGPMARKPRRSVPRHRRRPVAAGDAGGTSVASMLATVWRQVMSR
jgi:hypothetical protein